MNLYEGIKKNLNESVDFSDDDLSWLVELVENQMNPIYDAVDSRFNTNMGYDNSFCTDLCEYVEEEIQNWLDNNEDEYDESDKLNEGTQDSPTIKLSNTYKVIDVPKGHITATPSIAREINRKPLSKEKYGVLMQALADIITDIGADKEQLKDLRDDVYSEFNRALDFKESEKLKISESDLGDKVFTFGGEGSGFGVMEEEDLAYWKKELKKRHIKIKDIDDDLTFTVEGKLKDIYDFYNKVVDSGSLGMDYNNMEEFAEWSGLL